MSDSLAIQPVQAPRLGEAGPSKVWSEEIYWVDKLVQDWKYIDLTQEGIQSQARKYPVGTIAGAGPLLSRELDFITSQKLVEMGREYWAWYSENMPFVPYTREEIPLRALNYNQIATIKPLLDERENDLTNCKGGIAKYISYSEAQIRVLAKSLAEAEYSEQEQKVKAAVSLLGRKIPGKELEGRYRRTCSSKFWRRALRMQIGRAREHFFMRLALIGRGREAYVSDLSVIERQRQSERAQTWMKNTIVVPKAQSSSKKKGKSSSKQLCLADIATGNEERYAKMYTFMKAIDELAVQAKLTQAMLTTTLEPEWHSNPSHGKSTWNGAAALEAHKSHGSRWQSFQRDLHDLNIKITGLRVAEPHKDGCPHYHTWLIYKQEDESKILETLMRYFPLKLKVRNPVGASADRAHDQIYDSPADVRRGSSRPPYSAKEGAQVELSRVDRAISSGSSYAMKYVVKSAALVDFIDKGADGVSFDSDASKKAKKQYANLLRVDAFRGIWGIRQGQFFGIATCLTLWDELRRLNKRPSNRVLGRLWAQSRGGSKPGRIVAGSGQRGDAKAFLTSLGGLDACHSGNEPIGEKLILRRLVEEEVNMYGEKVNRTVGVKLLRIVRKPAKSKRPRLCTRYSIGLDRTWVQFVAEVKTRLVKWEFREIDRTPSLQEGEENKRR